MSAERADIEQFDGIKTSLDGVTGRAGKLVFIAFAAFAAWAFLVPLDSAVVAPSQIVSGGQNRVLQHPSGGAITAIHARDGDLLEKGDLVVELDPAVDQARLTRLKARDNVLSALRARLLAQKGESAEPVLALRGTTGIDGMLTASVGEGADNSFVAEQILEFTAGRAALDAQLRALGEQAEGQRDRLAGLTDQVRHSVRQVRLAGEQLARARALADAGHLAMQTVWTLEEQHLRAQGDAARLEAERGAMRAAIAQTEAEIENIRSTDARETSRQLTEIMAEAAEISDELAAAELARAQTVIRAPERGYLVHLNVNTVGGVVGPGDRLGEIVPADVPLEITGRVDVSKIASVEKGQSARMRISALNARLYDEVPAVISYIAADATTDEQTGQRYFEVRAKPDVEALEAMNVQLLPGMSGEMFITGTARTFASYLLQPVTDSLSRAFRESH